MSVTSNRSVLITFTSDVLYSQSFEAETNATGSGQNELKDLTAGDNTITVPTDAVAVTIIKPASNDVVLLLKVDAADVGWPLSLLDPDSISMDGLSTFIINADDDVTVRLIYS